MSQSCANPLLRDWVKEWMDHAQGTQSKAYYTYKKAYDSLCKCPVPFKHPSEAQQLNGIGAGMVTRLERCMVKHCKENNLPIPTRVKKRTAVPEETDETPAPAKKPRANRRYVPVYRSGAYAILLCLLDLQDEGKMEATRDQICRLAQTYCNASFTKPDAGKSYTAWNSIKTLMDKEYVWKHHVPAKFRLTETGVEMANQLRKVNLLRSNVQRRSQASIEIMDGEVCYKIQLPTGIGYLHERWAYPECPKSQGCSEFDVVLILDSREIQMRSNRDYIQQQLTEKGVKVETRSMNLGDVIWVARKRNGEELFLDYVLERKRLDDLISSIKDGRFTEQKQRLKKAGARQVFYLVEEYNHEGAIQFGLQAINTAMSTTQILDGIFLKQTNGLDESIDYLVTLTQFITRIYQSKPLHTIPEDIVDRDNYLEIKKGYQDRKDGDYLITYALYHQLNAKNSVVTVHDVYMRMLMTIRGVNAEKALSLMKVYPTPHSLLKAYSSYSETEGKLLAKNATRNQIIRRRWGSQISERLYQIWGSPSYSE
ncbi:hypothetical protein BDB01DRAFT_721807 [Pilobolus umbonatus]|nr:hypothetical protein BDB01DRAFT_721807 [Pilobolus umbonatus]